MQQIDPAATLILLRDRIDSAPEILLIERGQHLAFGGAMVFPGGRVDDDDAVVAQDDDLLSAGPELDPLDAAARVAAIRETIEEVGIAPAVSGLADPAMIADIRKRLADRGSFRDILRDLDLRLDLHTIHPFARWLPRLHPARAFDTRFYIARAPDHDEAVVDGCESSSCVWDTAASHIARAQSGHHRMVPPTQRNLERIGQVASFDEGVTFAARYPIDIISPIAEDRDGAKWLRIPDHLGYPVTSMPMPDLATIVKKG